MIQQLIRQAAEWRLLGLLLECPDERWREHVRDLAAAVADPVLASAAAQALELASEGLYHSAFGPGGPAAPREVSYCDSVQFGYLLSELEAYYDAFAYHPATAEAADHISVEAGFVSFLLLKEAYAHAAEDPESAAVTAEARQTFLREHLAWVAEPLAGRLEDSAMEYLSLAGRSLLERVGPSRERRALPGSILPILPQEGEFRCGSDDPA
jgi:nitrate reductase assembly molybdenum cofactor insertion protein NarJ